MAHLKSKLPLPTDTREVELSGVFVARRFHEEVEAHRDADCLDPQKADAGVPVKDLCHQAGISPATYYQWKSKYGGMEASDLKRVRELESEIGKLGRMYTELALDNAAMKGLIARKL